MVRTRRIRSEKLKEHKNREGYAGSLGKKGVEFDEDNNVKYMWDQANRQR